ncbi:hypothetical protein ACN38_g4689 [Penicillium nordicum]|uniref:Uncharacterized protein n=1 Tax=Penicillium nordicum TaxID=229535 RepID=A0A0M8P677_9EURO|nr:hypothetical protein ACN38_g4689 [Penicillium nordicum]
MDQLTSGKQLRFHSFHWSIDLKRICTICKNLQMKSLPHPAVRYLISNWLPGPGLPRILAIFAISKFSGDPSGDREQTQQTATPSPTVT